MHEEPGMTPSTSSPAGEQQRKTSVVLVMVCIYIFLVVERPWESIRYLEGIPIQQVYAIVLILVAFLAGKFRIVTSPTNKWVYSLLALHFILAPFAFQPGFAVEQGIKYAKMVVLYVLMLSVAEDEEALKVLIKAFVFAMMLYMLHSLWEYTNGRHVYRMGIRRMIGVDATYSDPNSFGASVVLSLPFAYALLRMELSPIMRKIYYCYFALAILCIILTGSRSTFVTLVFLVLLLVINQQGQRKFIYLMLAAVVFAGIWVNMPESKKERISTLWDEEAGPKSAHQSAEGRLVGLEASWRMFKKEPFTGVGAGRDNFIGYRVAYKMDGNGYGHSTQAHILYGEVIAEFGVFGAFCFAGLVFSIFKGALVARRLESDHGVRGRFVHYLSNAILASLLMLLFMGIGGHNFYRPLWLWLAAWTGSLMMICQAHTKQITTKDLK